MRWPTLYVSDGICSDAGRMASALAQVDVSVAVLDALDDARDDVVRADQEFIIDDVLRSRFAPGAGSLTVWRPWAACGRELSGVTSTLTASPTAWYSINGRALSEISVCRCFDFVDGDVAALMA